MRSNRRLRFAPDARIDVEDVLQHTLEHWGREQRKTYQARLGRAFDQLGRFPYLGQSRDDLAPGFRHFPVGQHVIYYALEDDRVVILRVLHQRRDPTGELER